MIGDTAAADSKLSAVFKRPFAQQVAFFRGKLGHLMPTTRWTDLWKSQHDRAFMVAGAAKADLLSDLAAAVDRGVSEGMTIESFRKDFDEIAGRHGWSYKGGRNWRTRTIFSTNISTSYSAGRLAQLREGGFRFWIYKHSDSSIQPRPLHVSWDGITLPADDPWWHTHYPPNGWGCKCRVVGAHASEDVQELGGRLLDKAPDDGIDPKTGEPAGIDKGWGYMPGATVADALSSTAEKTQKWEYSLAKAYMQNVPAGVRDDLARAYRGLPSVADSARQYAQRVLSGRTNVEIKPYMTLGLLTTSDAAKVKELIGVDVERFDYAMSPSAIRHIERGHGDAASEAGRGQRAVTAGDFENLPAMLNAPDSVTANEGIVLVAKAVRGEDVTAAFEVLSRRKMLSLKSMWVKPAPR